MDHDSSHSEFSELVRVVEALVFAANEPVSSSTLCRILTEADEELGEGVGSATVEEVVEYLNNEYEAHDRSFRIRCWAGGYRMATESDLAPFLEEMFAEERERTLSRSLMETLAIVAYQQPVTKPEVDHVRGVDAGYALRKLLERSLLEVVGRSDSVGRPLLYGTTEYFLDQFGLEALEDLPKPREINELLEDPAFEKEKTQLLMAEGLEPPEEGHEAGSDGSESSANGSEGSTAEPSTNGISEHRDDE